jgi:hypothetical protein
MERGMAELDRRRTTSQQPGCGVSSLENVVRWELNDGSLRGVDYHVASRVA